MDAHDQFSTIVSRMGKQYCLFVSRPVHVSHCEWGCAILVAAVQSKQAPQPPSRCQRCKCIIAALALITAVIIDGSTRTRTRTRTRARASACRRWVRGGGSEGGVVLSL